MPGIFFTLDEQLELGINSGGDGVLAMHADFREMGGWEGLAFANEM